MARNQEGIPPYRWTDIIRKASSQRPGPRRCQGTGEGDEGREGGRAQGQTSSENTCLHGQRLTHLQRRITALKEKREAKEEKERYEKMAAKMHQKRVDRLKRREKRNKLLKS
ncbi:unnamed protein product [Aureobasidium pullulans]|nr:unnamed protein product [Aureobasidium pullulans]